MRAPWCSLRDRCRWRTPSSSCLRAGCAAAQARRRRHGRTRPSTSARRAPVPLGPRIRFSRGPGSTVTSVYVIKFTIRTCARRARVSRGRAPRRRRGPELLRRSAPRDAAGSREAACRRAFSTAPRGKSGARRWRRATGTSSSSLSTTSSSSPPSELGSARFRDAMPAGRRAARRVRGDGSGAKDEAGPLCGAAPLARNIGV